MRAQVCPAAWLTVRPLALAFDYLKGQAQAYSRRLGPDTCLLRTGTLLQADWALETVPASGGRKASEMVNGQLPMGLVFTLGSSETKLR